MRLNTSWQTRTGGIDAAQFEIDWDKKQARAARRANKARTGLNIKRKNMPAPSVLIRFRNQDCLNCPSRNRCVRNKKSGRSLQVPIREMYEALAQTRQKLASDEGRERYKKRAGIEGTISQGVRRGSAPPVKIPRIGENTSSRSGNGSGDQYCAGSKLSEPETD